MLSAYLYSNGLEGSPFWYMSVLVALSSIHSLIVYDFVFPLVSESLILKLSGFLSIVSVFVVLSIT